MYDSEVASSRHNFGRNATGPGTPFQPASQYAQSVAGDDIYSFAASHHHHNVRDQRENGNDQSYVDIGTQKQQVIYADGSKFVGFVQRTGYGIFTEADGSNYQGYWKCDKKNGHGKMKYADGDFYEGNWLDDEMSGQGLFLK